MRLLHNDLDRTGGAFMGSPVHLWSTPPPPCCGVLEEMLGTVHLTHTCCSAGFTPRPSPTQFLIPPSKSDLSEGSQSESFLGSEGLGYFHLGYCQSHSIKAWRTSFRQHQEGTGMEEQGRGERTMWLHPWPSKVRGSVILFAFRMV